jgi:PAS domain S-box-containing protein
MTNPLEKISTFTFIRAASGFGCVLVVLLTVLYSRQDYLETLNRGEQRATLLANVLDAYTTRTLREIATAMQIMAHVDAVSVENQRAINGAVEIQRRRLPYLLAVEVIDSKETRQGSGDVSIIAALREWSANNVKPLSSQLQVGELLFHPTTGQPFIPLRLAVSPALASASSPEKVSPSAVVLAALSPDFLLSLHKAARYDADVLSVLIGSGGVITARAPALPKAIGLDVRGAPLYSADSVGTAERGILYGVSPSDGVSRVVSFRVLSEYGLRAYAGFDRDVAMSPWWARLKRNLFLVAILLILLIALGITAWRRATHEAQMSRALASTEYTTRLTLSALSEGLVTQDGQGRLLTWNPAALEILGLTADQIAGRTSLDPRWRAVKEDGSDFPGEQHPAMRALATKTPQLGVIMGVHRPDSGLRWLSINAVPTTDEASEARVVTSFIDVTEQRERAADLATLNATLESRVERRTEALRQSGIKLEELVRSLEQRALAQQRFIYILSHDLREPLNAIINFTHILNRMEAANLTKSGNEYLGFVSGSASRMKLLLDDLLKYVRLEDTEQSFQDVDLNQLLNEVKLDLDAAIRKSNACLVWEASIQVMADKSLLRILLQNLIINAIKFVPPDRVPNVVVTAMRDDDVVRINVQDNGMGIPANQYERVFDLFKRLHRHEAFEGTGLGLAICRRIVEIHGGSISVTSTVDVGTCFTVTLPTSPTPLNNKKGL